MCKDCKFIRALKHNFKTGQGFEESFVCCLWEYADRTPGDITNDIYFVEVSPNSLCEMFTPYGINNKE